MRKLKKVSIAYEPSNDVFRIYLALPKKEIVARIVSKVEAFVYIGKNDELLCVDILKYKKTTGLKND